jgi:hypothetical protein
MLRPTFLNCVASMGFVQASEQRGAVQRVEAASASLDFLPHADGAPSRSLREGAGFFLLEFAEPPVEDIRYEIFDSDAAGASSIDSGVLVPASKYLYRLNYLACSERLRIRLTFVERDVVVAIGPAWVQTAPETVDDGFLNHRKVRQKIQSKWAARRSTSADANIICFIEGSARRIGPYLRPKYVDYLWRPVVDHSGGSSANGPHPAEPVSSTDHLASFAQMVERSTNNNRRFPAPELPLLPAPAPGDVKVMAFYLPQFHPFPENDAWWGKGFTEWTNVSKAVPQFAGHYQPRFPGELGYYDLRLVDVMRRQAELARMFGLHGFCFHYYWFGGKRLLEKPIEQYLSARDIAFPFALCWANENWTRRWDGAEHEVLMQQKHSREDDLAFIRSLRPYFDDERYIRIHGKPLLVVYRPAILPTLRDTLSRWRDEAARMGFGGLHLVASNSFGYSDYRSAGFDAMVEFPPHNTPITPMRQLPKLLNPGFTGHVYSYAQMVNAQKRRRTAGEKIFPGVFPGWDNTARRPMNATIFHGSTPDLFAEWLRAALVRSQEELPAGERFVFINAWNEWAEGAYLEPDLDFGYEYLSRVRDAIEGARQTPEEGARPN